MSAAVITGSFVVTAVGAYWCLMKLYPESAQRCLRVGIIAGLISCGLQLFPTGDMHGKLVAKYQQPTLAAMEGNFVSGSHAELVLVGQPNLQTRRLENPIAVPWMLSYLSYGSFGRTVKGLNDIPKDLLPDNIELLYYVYHIMVGLGTMFMALMAWAAYELYRNRIYDNRLLLWLLMLAFPFPYIATTAGWMVAELGRQPWLVYGLLRTSQGTSPLVSSGDVAFSLLGFMGLYTLVGLLFVYLVLREVAKGPAPLPGESEQSSITATAT
jgi:cytochrome d ubiquinol oxidase subunit I